MSRRNRRNKKKRWSRRRRKEMLVGGEFLTPATSTEPNPVPVQTAPPAIETKISQTPAVPSAKEQKVTVPTPTRQIFDEKKSQEIIGHLKTVITVSLLCLVLVGALFFLDQKINLVNQINLDLKQLVTKL